MADKRKISAARRKEIAKKAAAARWSKPARAPMDLDQFCATLACSFNLPAEYYDKPAHISHKLLVGMDLLKIAAARARHIIQLGHEVGLPPGQSIASITIKNGKPLILGDAQLALVLNSDKAEYVKEYTDGGMLYDGDAINLLFSAVCEVKRFGDDSPTITRFSVQDAIIAGLWGIDGPWSTHPGRMMKYKARAFGLRDKFPDVLKGLTHSREEMEGVVMTTTRQAASDIVPDQATKELSGILETRMLHNTTQGTKGGPDHE